MENTKIPENKMGVMPMGKLVLSMSLPIALSMLVQACYNVVDSIYVAQIDQEKLALAAVSLAFPIQNLMIALASGVAIGMGALLSRSLGEKNHAEARRAAGNGLMLGIVCALAFAVFGVVGSRAFFAGQTGNPVIVEYGASYLGIVSGLSFGIFGEIMFERLLQSAGKSHLAMISQLVGAITNIILDPIMIFGFLGCPAMGVAGAALATVIGQMIAMALSLALNIACNTEVRLALGALVPNLNTMKTILKVGLPSVLMMSIGSVMTYGMNRILLSFGAIAVAVFGVYFKLQSFVFMPVFGLNSGLVPIVAYNYGARKKLRILSAYKISAIAAVSLMLIGLVVCQIWPEQLLMLFDASEEMLLIGTQALRAISWSFAIAGYCIATSGVFQAMGNGVYSLMISVARQLMVLLPAAYLFSLSGRLELVWYAFPLAELMALAVTTYLFSRIYKNLIAPLPDNGAEKSQGKCEPRIA